MPPIEGQDNEVQDFDMKSALAEVSEGLFGQGEPKDSPEVSKTPEGQPEGREAPSASPPAGQTTETPAPKPEVKPQENSTEVQALGAPKTWTKEALESWATIPPRAQQEILKREEDYFRGIGQYKERAEVADKYLGVVEPFKPILEAAQIDPVELFRNFASNHYLLSRGTPEQKVQIASNLIQHYQIDLGQLLDHIGNAPVEPPNPRIAALEQELATLRQAVTGGQKQAEEAAREKATATIDEFAADPAHPYFEEVADLMSDLLASGRAKTLKEAYDTAVYLNPETREKALAQLIEARTSAQNTTEAERQEKIRRATAADVTLTPKPKDGTIPAGSIDDTLAQTLAAIRGRSD